MNCPSGYYTDPDSGRNFAFVAVILFQCMPKSLNAQKNVVQFSSYILTIKKMDDTSWTNRIISGKNKKILQVNSLLCQPESLIEA